jgi:hypothetical protein
MTSNVVAILVKPKQALIHSGSAAAFFMASCGHCPGYLLRLVTLISEMSIVTTVAAINL